MRRLGNVFRRDQIDAEIEEELASHIEEAIERGRSPEEARRVFGGTLVQRERSRDVKLLPWLDALASDVVFGWRQLRKRPGVSAAAILSLALAIGATTAAFRLIDAVLLRKMPVADPEHLYYLAFTDRAGHVDSRDDFDYPRFRHYREVLADRAELILAGAIERGEGVINAGGEHEKVYEQFVSGNLFGTFGMQPALGRLLTPNDDRIPGGHPLAVLSYDFWSRRFARDPGVVGKSFRLNGGTFAIIGVAPKGFVGTEPGAIADVFVPAMMNTEALNSHGWSWFRIWVRPKPGFSADQVLQPLQADFIREREALVQNSGSGTPKTMKDALLEDRLMIRSAASGASDVQRQFRRPLLILGVLVALVLLIACTNLGNLLTAQAASRAREMALRVSIGAGQLRLVQLVLVESAMLAAAASLLSAVFAAWSAPLVVTMLHAPNDPVRLVLDSGWRGLAFSVGLALLVTLLFGLAPALRASNVKPVAALKGASDPHSRRGWMSAMLAAQMAFCVLVQFVAGLFVSTFERLSNRPLGFEADHLLVMSPGASQAQPAEAWMQLADRVRETPGVESVTMSGWPVLSRNRWSVAARVPVQDAEPRISYVLDVLPGFFQTMRIGLIGGRDFRRGEAGLAQGIVNEAFARTYFGGQNPVGKSVEISKDRDVWARMEIIGYVRDAVYYDVRERIHPTLYVPMTKKNGCALMVRTAGDPLALAPILRSAVTQARPDIQVQQVQLQTSFVRWQMLRERLLATLSLFFAIVALALAAVGLYGVLNYSVAWRRREIGIRIALGAAPQQVARRVLAGLLGVVAIGMVLGLAGGVACGRFVGSLLFEVKASDPGSVAAPVLALLAAAVLAAAHPVLRAVRIDPSETLRSE